MHYDDARSQDEFAKQKITNARIQKEKDDVKKSDLDSMVNEIFRSSKIYDKELRDILLKLVQEINQLKKSSKIESVESENVTSNGGVEVFLILLKEKQYVLSIDQVLDYVFNTIDDMLLEKKFILCDELLTSIKIADYSVDILVGILTITAPWKTRLRNRETFFFGVESYISSKLNADRASSILKGLNG